MRVDTRLWPIREECLLIILSLLKAWKVTMVGIECNNAAFYCHFKKVHTRNCYFKKNLSFLQNSASMVAN